MILFEIEQKFNWTSQNLQKLQRTLYHPRRHPLKPSKSKYQTFEDTYYDSHQKLCTNGLWVRKRLTLPGGYRWEAKQSNRPVNDFNRTAFEESDDADQILKWVRKYLPGALDVYRNFGLDRLCQFTTWRYSFKANRKFNVVLDRTNFGHQVGEIELLAEDADRAHAEIEAYMRKHAWFFDTSSKPKGKLTAYFDKFGYPKEEDYGGVD